ncbi:MAG: MurR/RpiR family transcriptional regulator [Ruminococcaceae bacterium]|nr:MurR/RpiR family transcriptional regulator [Oscillospiraceae bacterium]
MERTSLQIKILYNEMGRAEKKIADWIIQNPGKIIPLSISELADECQCSEATIVRFARRLGFEGYQALKISLAREDNARDVSESISPDDNSFEMFEKVCNDIYCSLERTKKVLNPESLSDAADRILAADKVITMGLGNSASVAVDMSHKFLRAGCNAVAYTDNHMQAIAASHLSAGDVAIGISHSGSSRDIVDALRIARERGAVTIAITNYGKSPILKVSDIVLQTVSDETKYSILALNSRIAQLAIVDSLYFYLVFRKGEAATSAIESTEKALLSKKF